MLAYRNRLVGFLDMHQLLSPTRLIVQALPDVAKNSATTRVASDANLVARIECQLHSLFVKQFVRGFDVYLLRMILHDCTFHDAVKIISRIIPAPKQKSRIIVIGTAMREPQSIPFAAERSLRVLDLTVL